MTEESDLEAEVKRLRAALEAKQAELEKSKSSNDAKLDGSGAIAQGTNATALGENATLIKSQNQVGNIIVGNDNRLIDAQTYIENQIIQIYSGEITQEQIDESEALKRYINHTIDFHQHLHIRGIRSTQPISIELENIFISLNAIYKKVVTEEEEVLANLESVLPGENFYTKNQLPTTNSQLELEVVIPVNEALKQTNRLVVLGSPGSGKTTMLSYLAITYARELLDKPGLVMNRLGLDDGGRLPVFLPLREFARHLRVSHSKGIEGPRPIFLLNYLYNYFENYDLRLPKHFFESRLNSGSCIVLLDGLDEVANYDERILVTRIVDSFTRRYPNNRFIVTSRIVGYHAAARLQEDYLTTTVRDFDETSIEQFVKHWSVSVEVAIAGKKSPTVTKRGEDTAQSLLNAIFANQRIRELAVNPLLLTVLALVHRNRAKLSERRVDLYEESIEVLLGYWDEGKGLNESVNVLDLHMDTSDKRSFLEPIAFWMHDKGLKELSDRDFYDLILERFSQRSQDRDLAEKRTKAFIKDIVERSGLIQERGQGVYSFSHLTFQEFLTARYLSGQRDYVKEIIARINSSWWRQVILLEAGYLSINSTERASELIQAIADAPESGFPVNNLSLATECLLEVGRIKTDPRLWASITARLLRAVGDEAKNVGHRITLANLLGELGDTRFEIVPLVEIPSGFLLMGRDRRVQRVFIPKYRIGKYPVTNIEYKRFIDATGYREPYRKEKWAEPYNWHYRMYPKGKANHPVVLVSWRDANAYCEWLSKTLNKKFRLPTEAEWERAAKGDDNRIWPWGNIFDPSKCNTVEGGVRGTTPVGIYTSGRSPYGVYDMAGNVREWTNSLLKDYPYDPDDGREDKNDDGFRVLRGGSYNYGSGNARSFFCNTYELPDAAINNIGFRIAETISEE